MTASRERGSVVREGVRRGGLELGHVLTNGEDMLGNGIWLLAMLAPVWVMREDALPGLDLSRASFVLPGVMALSLAFHGTFSVAQQLVTDRHDGTLLRLRSVPTGVQTYVVAKLTLVSSMVATICLVVTLVGIVLLEDVVAGNVRMWVTLAWLVPLSLLAMLPIGAMLGATVRNPRNVNILVFPLLLLAAVSGTFAPISGMSGWAQALVQVFPLHWIAIGARSALLPDAFAAAEVGGAWPHAQIVGVLAAWAVAGLLLTPIALRRIRLRRGGAPVRLEPARG